MDVQLEGQPSNRPEWIVGWINEKTGTATDRQDDEYGYYFFAALGIKLNFIKHRITQAQMLQFLSFIAQVRPQMSDAMQSLCLGVPARRSHHDVMSNNT
eukprot:scaffold499232_cov34-Prasinocladus_malaysianus.AAC.1